MTAYSEHQAKMVVPRLLEFWHTQAGHALGRFGGLRPRMPSAVTKYSAVLAGSQGDLYKNAFLVCCCQKSMILLVAA